jgi:P-type Cu2+ transporter
MKTSIIEVHDMLAVLTVEEVEERVGEVPGVESATANFAAGNVTVRYDEIRLNVADIKVIVHQRGHQPAGESVPGQEREHKPGRNPAAQAAPEASPASAAIPAATVPKAASVAPVAPAAGDHKGHEGHTASATASSPTIAAPKAPTNVLAAVPTTATPADPG